MSPRTRARPRPPRARPWEKVLEIIWVFLRRGICFLAIAATGYVVAGSLIFAPWWYGYFWDKQYRHAGYIAEALQVLVRGFFGIAVFALLVFFAAFVVFVLLRRQLFAFADRFWFVVVGCCVFLVTLDALIVLKTVKQPYRNLLVKTLALEQWNRLREIGAPPKIQPGIVFYYFDPKKAESLYNQFQQDLTLQEQTDTQGAVVKAGSTAVGGELQQKREKKLKRTEPGMERKCIEVMQHVAADQTRPAHYYTSDKNWLLFRALSTGPDPSTNLTPGFSKAMVETKVADYQGDFQDELSSLQGLLWVQGKFDEVPNPDGSTVLIEHFSPQFNISFRVRVPYGANIPAANPQLTVFGNVRSPLAGGYVEVDPIAIY